MGEIIRTHNACSQYLKKALVRIMYNGIPPTNKTLLIMQI